jgi:hypothetical protein
MYTAVSKLHSTYNDGGKARYDIPVLQLQSDPAPKTTSQDLIRALNIR